jgi:hypothetical protein
MKHTDSLVHCQLNLWLVAPIPVSFSSPLRVPLVSRFWGPGHHRDTTTDVLQLTPVPSDGDIALSLVSAGTFNVYYNATPDGDWSDPATFSSGTLIATFSRKESLFPEIGPIGFHALSESLLSSRSFIFDDRALDFNRIAPNGITFSQFFSTSPLTGTASYPVAFAGAGATMAVGGPLSTLPVSRRLTLPAIQMNRFHPMPDLFAIGNQPTYRTIFRTR